MIRQSYDIEQSVRATPTSGLTEVGQILQITKDLADFIETIRVDIDWATDTKPDHRLNDIEAKLSQATYDIGRIGSIMSDLVKKQNSLADEVEKMKKVFEFIAGEKERRNATRT